MAHSITTVVTVGQCHGNNAAPRYYFSTVYQHYAVKYTVLFGTAIPQVPRFYRTVFSSHVTLTFDLLDPKISPNQGA